MISVIVPCYNYAHFLNETLLSIQSQTYKDWECIIINDGSTDNTEEIANLCILKDNRFRYFKKENGGLSSSRNAGISLALGDYIQFLDADDTLHPEKFEKQLEVFNALPNLDVCYSDFLFFNDQNEYYRSEFPRTTLNSNPLLDFIMNWGFEFIIPIHSPLFKQRIIKETEILFDLSLKAREDWLFWITISQNTANFYFLNEPLAFYRKHSSSMVHDPIFMMQNTFKACLKVYTLIPEEYKEEFSRKYAGYLSNDFQKMNVEFTRINNSITINTIRKIKKITNLFK